MHPAHLRFIGLLFGCKAVFGSGGIWGSDLHLDQALVDELGLLFRRGAVIKVEYLIAVGVVWCALDRLVVLWRDLEVLIAGVILRVQLLLRLGLHGKLGGEVAAHHGRGRRVVGSLYVAILADLVTLVLPPAVTLVI